MSGYPANDDLFSPVRFDSSVLDGIENSDGSLSDISSSDLRLSFSGSQGNKCVLEDSNSKYERKSGLNSNDQNPISPELINISTPPSNKIKGNALNINRLEKINYFKERNAKKGNPTKNFESQEQKSKARITALDSNPFKQVSEQKTLKEKSSSSVLSSSIEFAEFNIKNVKTKEKDMAISFKNVCNTDNIHASSTKLSSERKLDNSTDVNVLKYKDVSEKSSKVMTGNLTLDPLNQNLNSLARDEGNLEVPANLPFSHYEASIEKIVHDCISFECDKIRQNIYMQQMSYYRQINKIKAQMEQQHSTVTERLFKVIEELVQINATLKSISG